MNIFHIIVLKIAGVISAVMLMVTGAGQAVPVESQVADLPQTTISQPTATVIDIPAPQAQPSPAAPAAVPVYVIQPTAAEPVFSSEACAKFYNLCAPATGPATVEAPSPLPVVSSPAPMKTKEVAQIAIISPIGTLRLGRELLARPEPLDESNQVLVGGVITLPDGTNVRDAVMTVTTSDPDQKAEITGTGDFTGSPQNVYYYSFTYNVRTTGEHTITFTAAGASKSVTFNVSKEDTR